MLEFVKGNFFDYDADIRINTVNCVSVMGAGVALAFKTKYPEMFKEYVKSCKTGELKPGSPTTWSNGDMFSSGITIINFPTKNHWRRPSKYEYVESGLKWLANYLQDKNDKVVTLPALGCGHGGLEWKNVKILINKYLRESPSKILVFEPSSSKKISNKSIDLISLSNIGIKNISEESLLFPQSLRNYTKKNLYIFGDNSENINFDFALICSTKPNDNEKNIIQQFIKFCIKNNLTVVFGSSVFEKKLAVEYANENLNTGVFLPSGIYDSANKIIDKKLLNKITLLSLGNPYKNFDRKEYLPSVLGRMCISKRTVFTTNRLAWISKQKKKINEQKISSQYIPYENLDEKDTQAVLDIKSEIINFDNVKNSYVFKYSGK